MFFDLSVGNPNNTYTFYIFCMRSQRSTYLKNHFALSALKPATFVHMYVSSMSDDEENVLNIARHYSVVNNNGHH